MQAPTLAVVIPATDDPPTLERCTTALEESSSPAQEVVVQREPAGAGPAAARNLGAARTTGEVIVFVDADVEVHPDALAAIEARFSADPDLAALFGAYDDSPAAPGLTSRFRNLLHHHVHASAPGGAETFWAGLGAVRRDAFAAVGGFDASRFSVPSVEDLELGVRLHRRGLRIVLDPAIRGRHLKRWTLRSMVATDFARRGVPWTQLLLRERGAGGGALNLGWRHRASAAASLALLIGLSLRRPRLGAAALGAGLFLNRSFYALLARRGGSRLALAGIGLHQLHHLTAVASVPAGAILHWRERAAG